MEFIAAAIIVVLGAYITVAMGNVDPDEEKQASENGLPDYLDHDHSGLVDE